MSGQINPPQKTFPPLGPKTPPKCPTCGLGFDDDGDGNCVFCGPPTGYVTGVPEVKLAKIRQFQKDRRYIKLFWNAAEKEKVR